MGLFRRKDEAQELVALPAEFVAPRHSGEELEHMVADTYRDKLQLQARLDAAKRTIESQRELATKLDAAELLAKSSQNEIKELQRRLERAESERESWKHKATRVEDSLAVARVQRDDIYDSVRDEVVDVMLEALVFENGGWSKDRVREFVSKFRKQQPEPEVEFEIPAPDSTEREDS